MGFDLARQASAAPFPQDVCRLLEEVFVGEGLAPAEARASFEGPKLAARGTAWIARAGDSARAIGVVFLVEPTSPARQIAEDGELEVHLLAVDRSCRRSGVAEALMNVCLHEARLRGARRVVLSTHPPMAGAQALYAKLGFERAPGRDWTKPDGRRALAYVLAPAPLGLVTRAIPLPGGGALEVITTEALSVLHPIVCSAHPAEPYTADTARLLGEIAGAQVVVVNPRGLGASTPPQAPQDPRSRDLEAVVRDLELVRAALAVPSWTFWGLSGGGWIAQAYAFFSGPALDGFIVESACACFRERLADPDCVLSPRHASWSGALDRHGLAPPAPAPSAGERAWCEVEGIGLVLREPGGPALLVAGAGLPDSMRRALPRLIDFDARPWLPLIARPALILAGGRDLVAPLAHVRRVHDLLAGARWMLVEAGGHVPSIEGSEAARTAIRAFVLEHAPGSTRGPASAPPPS